MRSTDPHKKKPGAAAPAPLCRYEELAIRENRAREAAAAKDKRPGSLIDPAD